jgi:hypothetical protein
MNASHGHAVVDLPVGRRVVVGGIHINKRQPRRLGVQQLVAAPEKRDLPQTQRTATVIKKRQADRRHVARGHRRSVRRHGWITPGQATLAYQGGSLRQAERREPAQERQICDLLPESRSDC